MISLQIIFTHNITLIQSFQWIEANKAAIPNGVVPIRKLDSQPFCIDVYAEDYRDDDS